MCITYGINICTRHLPMVSRVSLVTHRNMYVVALSKSKFKIWPQVTWPSGHEGQDAYQSMHVDRPWQTDLSETTRTFLAPFSKQWFARAVRNARCVMILICFKWWMMKMHPLFLSFSVLSQPKQLELFRSRRTIPPLFGWGRGNVFRPVHHVRRTGGRRVRSPGLPDAW